MALDERLRREIDRVAEPADPSGVYERLIRRKERRRIAQKVQVGALALVVIVGTVGGFLALTRVFGGVEEPPPASTPSVSNGLIVFSRPLDGAGEHLFAVDPDGSGLRQLTPEGAAVYRSPDVSPNGRTVAVVHEIPSFAEGRAVLATVPIEGGSPTWLLSEPHIVLDPAWSPDGGRIAFAGSVGDPYGIYVLDIESGEARLIPGTDEISVGDPTWSPDGTRIAFEGSTDVDTDPNQSWDIYTVRPDGSEMTNLTRTPDFSELMPAWSWTVDRIAFIEVGPAEGALLTMSAAGTERMTAYSGELAPANPAWSPDGTAIAFEGGSEGIFTVRADGTGFTALPDARGVEPAWQPLVSAETVAPVPEPTGSTGVGEDIGLGLRLCDVTTVRGTFSDEGGEVQTAFVGTQPTAEGCPPVEQVTGVAALDLTGDGVADIASEPFMCEGGCLASAAPDVDGDGTDELLVQDVFFTIVGLRLLDLDGSGTALVTPVVEPPGDATLATQGFDGSGPPRFWIGGDAFVADALRCEDRPEGRVMISTTAESLPHDSPDAVWQIHETTFELRDGVLRVLEARDLEEPAGPGTRPSFMSTGGCGADLQP